jgi:predicted DCC family thiol-disulfide oxidoreductase YuxK
MNKHIVVIYDGQCQFCQSSIDWIEQKLVVDSKPFQQADLAKLELTYEQCSKAVHVIAGDKVLVGAAAIAYLLKARGNRALSLSITTSGPFARFGYRWVSLHRNSLVVRFVHLFLKQSNLRHKKKQKD